MLMKEMEDLPYTIQIKKIRNINLNLITNKNCIMKRKWMKIVIVFFMGLLVFSGCNQVKDLLDVTFTADNVTVSFTVNPAAAGAYSTTDQVVTSDLNDQIASNGGNISALKNVELQECTINVVTAGRNLDPFQSVEVWVKVDGQPDKEIAWNESVPAGVTSVPLSISGDDIKALIDQDQYTVTVKGILDGALETAIDLQAILKYKVVVGPK
jgi:hypothetical protein